MAEPTKTAAQLEQEREDNERRTKAKADFAKGKEIAATLPETMRRADK